MSILPRDDGKLYPADRIFAESDRIRKLEQDYARYKMALEAQIASQESAPTTVNSLVNIARRALESDM
jgi:hypothetical protein